MHGWKNIYGDLIMFDTYMCFLLVLSWVHTTVRQRRGKKKLYKLAIPGVDPRKLGYFHAYIISPIISHLQKCILHENKPFILHGHSSWPTIQFNKCCFLWLLYQDYPSIYAKWQHLEVKIINTASAIFFQYLILSFESNCLIIFKLYYWLNRWFGYRKS